MSRICLFIYPQTHFRSFQMIVLTGFFVFFRLFSQSLFIMLRTISAHNEFFERLLSSMRFQQFILERGPPFRVCDVFDEVYDASQPPERTSNLWPIGTEDQDAPSPSGTNRLGLDERLSQKLLENVISILGLPINKSSNVVLWFILGKFYCLLVLSH